MSKMLRGMTATLALAAAFSIDLSPSAAQVQSNPPSGLDASITPQPPVTTPSSPPSTSAFVVYGAPSRPRPVAPYRLAGEKPTPAARVKPGGVIVAFPFAYNRTAVLTENSEPGKSKPLLRTGAPGYYAGTFGLPGQAQGFDIWCFKYAEPPLGYLCAHPYSQGPGGSGPGAGVVNVKNTYVFSAVTFLSGRAVSRIEAFVFEEKPVEIPGDLRMEYRFKRWTKTEARIEQWAGGRRADEWVFKRRPDGSVLLRTLAGAYRLTPAADAPDEADISER
ncbi:hypothetical protein [Caulobacter sp. LARHSG274]